MDLKLLAPGIVGAFFGALGWLLVGLFMQRQSYLRQAVNAGRAVYFELLMNRLSVDVALHYDSFSPLSRSSFDRLLPELATWLAPRSSIRSSAPTWATPDTPRRPPIRCCLQKLSSGRYPGSLRCNRLRSS